MRRRPLWLAVGVLVGVLAALYGVRRLAGARTVQLFGRLVARVETGERRVALTFDDGPTRSAFDSIVGVLAARDVQATFFVTGRELARAPELGHTLVERGHELGNHSYSHRRMVLVSPGFVRAGVERTDSLIRAVGHRGPIYFRPPYGYKLAVLPWYLARTGRTTVTWDVEPDSYADVAATPEGIVRHVLDRVRPGSIIILHVWYPSRATSLAAVGPLVDSLRARDYEVGTVGALLGGGGAAAPGSVVGHWQRVDQPRESIQFDADGTFKGRGPSPSDTTLIRGRFEQRGAVVTGTSVYGHTRRLVLRDTMLIMDDGTRYRRVRPE